ncbi:ATP-dependent DNA helicase [Trichonephila clavipes]|uniref:ATP-dependent DNA helicase n=1 Tax=Trichonephila clavipes TaxID=2585209 RepID=A0A8X6UXK3_TRICX|nr:ATP-dependent DNA helicase [Trichonephila clavipes]
MINQNEPRLNKEQNQVYRLFTDSVNANAGGVYFLDASGGTGKFFFDKSFTGHNTFRKKIAAVASSGIAEILLHKGKTGHSMFKIPLESERMENPVCSVTKSSDKAKVLQDFVFVVWVRMHYGKQNFNRSRKQNNARPKR